MLFFVVENCELKACQNWRLGDNCVKDNMHIPTCIHYAANMHDSTICQVRKQIDEYRLTEMLETQI